VLREICGGCWRNDGRRPEMRPGINLVEVAEGFSSARPEHADWIRRLKRPGVQP
jgi:hypothetical protein